MSKLMGLGLDPYIINWLRNYLANRRLASFPGPKGGGERAPGTHCLRMRLIATEFRGDSACTCTYVNWWRHKLAALMCPFMCSWCSVRVNFISLCSWPSGSWIPLDIAQNWTGCLQWVPFTEETCLFALIYQFRQVQPYHGPPDISLCTRQYKPRQSM